MGQAGARFCLSLLRRVMQGAPCHAHRHRHMMHFFYACSQGSHHHGAQTPSSSPRRESGNNAPAARSRAELNPRTYRSVAIRGDPQRAGAARTHACACIGLSRRRRQSWRLLECCGSVDRCVQQLVPPSLRPGSELDCGMAIAHMLAHMWPKQARRRVHSQAWFTQKPCCTRGSIGIVR